MRGKELSIGVIISTYNNPIYLERVLDGYTHQTCLPSEILIADDGSKQETELLVKEFAKSAPFKVKHIWHPDEGFRKCTILNNAIKACESEYIVVTDHDCIPREDFIETHLRFAKKGRFLSGGYSKLPKHTSALICAEKIPYDQVFSLRWLRQNGLPRSFRNSKLFRSKPYAWLLNHLTTAKASWNGCNSSGWKEDLVAVNGFNQDMQYGGLDRELGERLANYGLKGKQIRYSAVVIHLYHDRPYKTRETMDKNHHIRKHVRKTNIVRTPNGIQQL